MAAKLVLFGDFETTGLDTSKDVALEAYFDLRLVEPNRAQTTQLFAQHAYIDSVFDRAAMHPSAVRMHEANGLFADLVRHADARISVAALDSVVAAAVANAAGAHPGLATHLGGMGVANYDKRLIERDMPLLNRLLHYRCDDVSVVEMFAKDAGWTPPVGMEAFASVAHRAKEDVEQAIAKYEHFRAALQLSFAPAAA